MPTQTKNIWFLSSADGTPPPVRTYPISASMGTFMPGAPFSLTKGTAGKLDIVAHDETTILGYCIGVVSKSIAWPLTGTLAVDTEVRVAIARPNDLYVVHVTTTDTDTTVLQANVGINYAIRVSTTAGQVGFVSMDKNDISNDMFGVVDIMANREPSKYSTADSPGYAIVKHVGTLEG